MSILDEIVANKRVEMDASKKAVSLDALRAAAMSRPVPPDFVGALRSAPVGLIAEVKRRSPSAGVIREPFDPAAIARAYEAAGAQAISVLIDQKFFGGGEKDFLSVRAAVRLPLLYKEFVVDAWQIWHAASLGASAVLLIAAVLDRAELERFLALCREARVEALVEVHDEADLEKLGGLPVRCVGINNRDLRTFKVSLDTTERLARRAPAGCTLVSESGIHSSADVAHLKTAGAHAVLVGERLLRQQDVGRAVRELMGRFQKP